MNRADAVRDPKGAVRLGRDAVGVFDDGGPEADLIARVGDAVARVRRLVVRLQRAVAQVHLSVVCRQRAIARVQRFVVHVQRAVVRLQ